MNQATKEFRKKVADVFVQALSEKKLEWKKNWGTFGGTPINACTGKYYRGINRFYLSMVTMAEVQNGCAADNRWATFKQINDKGWKVRKGAKGYKVEYWQPYDFKEKKPITWDEFKNSSSKEGVNLIAKYYVVFNGRDIEGIPELKVNKERLVVSDELIKKISTGMEVRILNDGGEKAFYRPSEDVIHLPSINSFYSSYDYNSTALHELAHATGAEKRLHRNINNMFGSPEYAYEELVAEISSCFMGEHLQIEQTEDHMKNHKAYVQSWIQDIQEKPETLIQAVRDAGAASNLLEYHAGILTLDEYHKTLNESMEISDKKTNREIQHPKKSYSIEKDIKNNGYIPTKALVNQIEEVNSLTGRENSIHDICNAGRNKEYMNKPVVMKKINCICKMLSTQELNIPIV